MIPLLFRGQYEEPAPDSIREGLETQSSQIKIQNRATQQTHWERILIFGRFVSTELYRIGRGFRPERI